MRKFLDVLRHIGLGLWWLARNLVLAPLAWVARELFGQAKTGTKKLVRPFLWPAVGLGLLVLLYSTAQPQVFDALLRAVLTLGIMGFALWLMFRAVFPKKKKKS